MLTIPVKNTALYLNGQNLRLAAKNGGNSRTPGLHLSAAQGKEAVGQFTASPQTREGTAHSDLLLRSPRPDIKREPENGPVQRPLRLAPLVLSDKVREAQRQKLTFIPQEAKAAACTMNSKGNEQCTRKVKSCVRPRVEKAATCTVTSAELVKAKPRSSRPQLTRFDPIVKNGSRPLEDVVCQGTPALSRTKPAPPVLTPRLTATCGGEAARRNPVSLQQGTGSRRWRLSRAQCLDEDQCNSNTAGGLPADEDKLAQGVRGKGQRADGALRSHTQAGKGVRKPTAESRERKSVSKSHQEDRTGQQAKCCLKRQSAEGGADENTADAVKSSASTGRLKRINH